MVSTILRYAALISGALLAYWTLLFLVQRRLMFPSHFAIGIDAPPPPGTERVWLDLAVGRVEAWSLPPLSREGNKTALLIFAHGNAELIDHWVHEFDEPRRWGMRVLLVEYPGYGRSTGRSSERTIRSVFSAAYDWAIEGGEIDPERVIGYGRSVGGGAIGALSHDRPLAALIFESSFTSTRPFARRFGAPGFLVRDPFDNLAAVRSFHGPVLVMHGRTDDVIPYEHGQALAQAADATFYELPCGHNDCTRSWPVVGEFLRTAGLIRIPEN